MNPDRNTLEPVEPRDTYLQRMRLKYHTKHRTSDQQGIADLPLFQTDIEEFTGTTSSGEQP